MEIENNQESIINEEDPIVFPAGWGEADDFYGAESDTEQAAEAEEEQEPDAADDTATEEDPTTDPAEQTSTDPAGETAAEPETPTTEEEPAEQAKPGKLRFKARIDHEDVDAEIDESELPNLYQKATATDRYQAKLAKVDPTLKRLERMAKANGYDTVDAMLDAQEAYERDTAIENLVKQGTPKEIAEDYVDRRLGRTAAPAQQEPEATETASGKSDPAARDFTAEVNQLWNLRPELRGVKLPAEVATAAANGENLVLAYFAYEAKQSKAAAEALRKENEVYKQNAAAAAKAPVKGTSGGGATGEKAVDPFLQGMMSRWGD